MKRRRDNDSLDTLAEWADCGINRLPVTDLCCAGHMTASCDSGDWRLGEPLTVRDVSGSAEKISFFCYSGFAATTVCLGRNHSQIKAKAACRRAPQGGRGDRSLMVVLSGLRREGLCGFAPPGRQLSPEPTQAWFVYQPRSGSRRVNTN